MERVITESSPIQNQQAGNPPAANNAAPAAPAAQSPAAQAAAAGWPGIPPVQASTPTASVAPATPAQAPATPPTPGWPGMEPARPAATAAKPAARPVAKPAATAAPSPLTVKGCVISHRGCVRDNNEDNFFFDGDLMLEEEVDEGTVICDTITKPFHIFAICDGMGGLKGGERASAICVRSMSVLNISLPPDTIPRAIDVYADEACKKVYQDSLDIGEDGREGSTLALLYMIGGKAFVGNVGDSRVYVLRMGKLYQLSTDHSPVYRKMIKGELTREQMRKHPQGNVIGAYIGMAEDRKPKPYASHFQTPIYAGDRFMLCSDGLSDLISHDELQRRLNDTPDPKNAASQLIWRAMEMGGKDNTTVMVLDVSAPELPKPNAMAVSRLPQER